jgi:hypothetical protein
VRPCPSPLSPHVVPVPSLRWACPCRSPCTGSSGARAGRFPCRSPYTGSCSAHADRCPCRSPCTGSCLYGRCPCSQVPLPQSPLHWLCLIALRCKQGRCEARKQGRWLPVRGYIKPLSRTIRLMPNGRGGVVDSAPMTPCALNSTWLPQSLHWLFRCPYALRFPPRVPQSMHRLFRPRASGARAPRCCRRAKALYAFGVVAALGS